MNADLEYLKSILVDQKQAEEERLSVLKQVQKRAEEQKFSLLQRAQKRAEEQKFRLSQQKLKLSQQNLPEGNETSEYLKSIVEGQKKEEEWRISLLPETASQFVQEDLNAWKMAIENNIKKDSKSLRIDDYRYKSEYSSEGWISRNSTQVRIDSKRIFEFGQTSVERFRFPKIYSEELQKALGSTFKISANYNNYTEGGYTGYHSISISWY